MLAMRQILLGPRGAGAIIGIDNNASEYNYNTGSGVYDSAAVINTNVIPDVTTEIVYCAYLYPIGANTSGYVTGVYFGSLSRDDASDSFWARAFVPDWDGSANIQARIGNRATSFYSLSNSDLAYHVIKLSTSGFYLDEQLLSNFASPTFSPSPRYPIFIGGANLAGRCWRAYRQIITDVVIRNGAGVNMHLKPAESNGKAGMIDVNNGNMFYGSATGVDFMLVS